MDSNETEIGVTLAKHVDRISTLPDAILSHILSLIPTKDSVRTSALSTRWTHLYASVPILDIQHFYNRDLGPTPPDSSFVAFVSKILNTVITKLSRISKFRLHKNTPSDSSDILSWIETAVSHSVQELDVCCDTIETAPTPHCIFNCDTIVSMSLNVDFELSIADNVCLPKLKELFLSHIILSDESDDESVKRLFSSCPVLENLSVESWLMDKFRVINVSVPSLKFLKVFLHDTECEIVINCPNLEILRCESYPTIGYSGDMLGSLKECYIETELPEEQLEDGKLMQLVKQVSKVRFLTLAGDSMQALLSSPCSLPTFENLTRLELIPYYSSGWRLLSGMLESSPRLETLVFPMGFFDRHDYDGIPFSPSKNIPTCLSFHLKVIKINRFLGDEDEYELVEYFLTNALVLEKLEICPWSDEGSEEENDPNVEGEVKKEGEMEVEKEEEVEREKVEGEGQGEEDERQMGGEDEADGEFESDLERHFEITKRLLTLRRFSEACQIVIVSPEEREDNTTICK